MELGHAISEMKTLFKSQKNAPFGAFFITGDLTIYSAYRYRWQYN